MQANSIINKRNKPISKNNIIVAEDYCIVSYYRRVALGLLSYFRCCDNLRKVIDFVDFQLRYSLGYTLKNKHKESSIRQIFKKYGRNLEIVITGNYSTSFIDSIELRKTKKKFLTFVTDPYIKLNYIYRSFSCTNIFNNECAIVDCLVKENIEIHHIKKLYRNINYSGCTTVVSAGKSKKLKDAAV